MGISDEEARQRSLAPALTIGRGENIRLMRDNFQRMWLKGWHRVHQMLAPALAIYRTTDQDKNAPECDPFRRRSLPKSKDDKA
jgi:hypothetical protein